MPHLVLISAGATHVVDRELYVADGIVFSCIFVQLRNDDQMVDYHDFTGTISLCFVLGISIHSNLVRISDWGLWPLKRMVEIFKKNSCRLSFVV